MKPCPALCVCLSMHRHASTCNDPETQAVQELEKVATPSTLFYAENAAILPLWAGMIIWPEKPLTKAVMSTYAPVVAAALVYIWLTYESFQVQNSYVKTGRYII